MDVELVIPNRNKDELKLIKMTACMRIQKLVSALIMVKLRQLIVGWMRFCLFFILIAV